MTEQTNPMTADEAKDLSRDPLFKKLQQEMDNIIEGEKNKMVFSKDEHEMVRCQERVQALRFVSRLPEAIIDRESDIEEEKEEKKIITTGG